MLDTAVKRIGPALHHRMRRMQLHSESSISTAHVYNAKLLYEACQQQAPFPFYFVRRRQVFWSCHTLWHPWSGILRLSEWPAALFEPHMETGRESSRKRHAVGHVEWCIASILILHLKSIHKMALPGMQWHRLAIEAFQAMKMMHLPFPNGQTHGPKHPQALFLAWSWTPQLPQHQLFWTSRCQAHLALIEAS